MSQVYFHCSSAREVRVDQCGAAVSSLAEARDYAACLASRIEGVMSAAHVTSMLDRIVTGWQRLIDRATDSYRPERHYMRGPGPKWHAKHRAGTALL